MSGACGATTDSLHDGNRVPRFVRVEPPSGLEVCASACGGSPRPAFRPAAMSGHESRLRGTRKVHGKKWLILEEDHKPFSSSPTVQHQPLSVKPAKRAFPCAAKRLSVSGGKAMPAGQRRRFYARGGGSSSVAHRAKEEASAPCGKPTPQIAQRFALSTASVVAPIGANRPGGKSCRLGIAERMPQWGCARAEGVGLAEAEGRAAKRPQGPARRPFASHRSCTSKRARLSKDSTAFFKGGDIPERCPTCAVLH